MSITIWLSQIVHTTGILFRCILRHFWAISDLSDTIRGARASYPRQPAAQCVIESGMGIPEIRFCRNQGSVLSSMREVWLGSSEKRPRPPSFISPFRASIGSWRLLCSSCTRRTPSGCSSTSWSTSCRQSTTAGIGNSSDVRCGTC